MNKITSTQRISVVRDRYVLIDAVRGFALFGVFLSNFYWTSQWVSTPSELALNVYGASANNFLWFIHETFTSWKFLSIFSILFGLGFAIMIERIEEKGLNSTVYFTRRLFVLLIIGIIHVCFLWYGDILHLYAALGFLLLALRRLSNKAILRISLIFIIAVPADIDLLFSLQPQPIISVPDRTTEFFKLFTSTSYLDMIRGNIEVYHDFQMNEGLRLWTSVFGRLLFGFWLGRQALLQYSKENLAFWKRIAFWCISIGVNTNLQAVIINRFTGNSIWNSAGPLYMVLVRGVFVPAQMALGLGYIALLVVLWEAGHKRVLGWLAAVGRMALTNYLIQSVLIVFFLNGIGLNLLGKLSMVLILALVIILYSLQMFASIYWLKHFTFGPIEWIWRTLTYRYLQPFRLSKV